MRGTQAAALATHFRAENEALIAFVLDLSEAEWAMECPDEGRSVGVVVQHIAEGHRIAGAIVRAIAAGRPLPIQARRTVEQGAAFNAGQARHLAAGTRDDGLRMLRSNGERMARFIERLSDKQRRCLTDYHVARQRVVSASECVDDGLSQDAFWVVRQFEIAHPEAQSANAAARLDLAN